MIWWGICLRLISEVVSVDLDVPSGIKHRHSHGLVCTARNRWVTMGHDFISLFFSFPFFHDFVFPLGSLTSTKRYRLLNWFIDWHRDDRQGVGEGGKTNFLSFFSFWSILGIKKCFNSSVILILARHKSQIDNGVFFFKNNNIPISHQLFAIFNHCLTAIH